MSITTYFTDLNKFQISLADHGISTSIRKKVMAAGARMWESEMLTEDQMVAWENRPAIDQKWTNLQTYFMEKWLERANTRQPQQSSRASRKQHWRRKSKRQLQKKAKHKLPPSTLDKYKKV